MNWKRTRRIGKTEIPRWDGETYYDVPPVKPVPWDWKVATYVFLGGVGGAAQVLGLLADWRRPSPRPAPPPVTRRARWLGVGGVTLGAPLIIADLKTPRRFYNMLRIIRPTSGMSIGSWLLAAFGASSGLALLAQLTGFRRTARAAHLPAALAGAGMATYTGALFGATSTPRWAAASNLLAARFGLSSMAAGAAALSLGERHGPTWQALDTVSLVALSADTALSFGVQNERRAEGTDAADRFTRDAELAAKVLHVLPVVLYAANGLSRRPSPTLSTVASTLAIAASWLTRVNEMRGARASARRPEDTFRLAQPPGSGGRRQ
ncbi:hypothetical protein C882_0678 [Caenispirillum salinarum AK4]|uniref:Uncharacterized protein n=2 Tax=Caenispirillum TaxID=414051 RepID=K9GSE3_9PROT|nr:hypothetical protein C882_0678 [Caenispirillum salinarum AK4]